MRQGPGRDVGVLLLPLSAGEWAGNGMQLPGHCGSHWDGEQAGSIFREVTEELVISSSGALLGFKHGCSSSGFLEARQAPIPHWGEGTRSPQAGDSSTSVSGARRYPARVMASPTNHPDCTGKFLWGNPWGKPTGQGSLRGEMPLQRSRESSLL